MIAATPSACLWLTCFKNLEELSLCKLSDKAELVRSLEGVEQQNDVWMVQPSLNVYFL